MKDIDKKIQEIIRVNHAESLERRKFIIVKSKYKKQKPS